MEKQLIGDVQVLKFSVLSQTQNREKNENIASGVENAL